STACQLDAKRGTRGLAALTVREGKWRFRKLTRPRPIPECGHTGEVPDRTARRAAVPLPQSTVIPFHNRYRKLGNFRLVHHPEHNETSLVLLDLRQRLHFWMGFQCSPGPSPTGDLRR